MNGTLELADFIKNEQKDPILICFVCTGNTCRSPMAAAVYNDLAAKSGLPSRAISAGLYPDGISISPNAARALADAGIEPTAQNDYLHHIPRPVSEALIDRCERLVGISSAHAMELMMRFPRYAGKITSLSRDISDPYGGDVERYRRCLAEITAVIREGFFQC
ncbi:MAG: hypothetical protein IJ493_10170 [Clostridia bacterium]|nr:hypothetical protein [Clostridia bacterium]